MKVLTKERRVHALAADVPNAYAVSPGEVFWVETQDAMDGQIPAQGRCVAEVDSGRSNPMTGPIAVRGAQPGQTLAIQILDIVVDAQGWMSRSPSGLVNAVQGNLVEFMPGIQLSVRPMVGVIGLTPPEGSYTGGDVTHFGGNFDIKQFTAGTTVYLPVGVQEAGLALGDVHALQADGECSGTGVEIGARILLRTALHEHGLSDRPYFYREGVLSTVGVDPDLRQACQLAVDALAGIVSQASGLDLDHSRMFLSLTADVHVGQFVCPIQSAYASLDLGRCPWPINLGT